MAIRIRPPSYLFKRNMTRLNLRAILITSSFFCSSTFASASLHTSQSPAPLPTHHEKGNVLSHWLDKESRYAFDKVIANIGPPAGALDGLVVASPSKGGLGDEPDYFYTWTRDSALTISALLPYFLPAQYLRPWETTTTLQLQFDTPADEQFSEALLEPLIRAFVEGQAGLQTLRTRSGDLWRGGLNEPKYQANGTSFDEEWGRPQRDGPALRALSIIPYANYLLDRGLASDLQYVKDHLYDHTAIRRPGKVVKNDLEEVAGGWWEPGFDLWEEVNGHHLFTRLASLRALQAGAKLADRLNDPQAARYYLDVASKIEQRLAYFWEYKAGRTGSGYWVASTFGQDQLGEVEEKSEVHESGRSGLDCAFALSVIHLGDRDRRVTRPTCTSSEPGDPGTIATLLEYVKSFEGLYEINDGKVWTDGWVLGRYKEDVYDGVGQSTANPWFICTFSFAHTLYLAYGSFTRAGEIQVDKLTAPFWEDVLGRAINGNETWKEGEEDFTIARTSLWEVAERYVEAGKRYTGEHGEMSEQINRSTGRLTGARDLTWSYASLIELRRARKEAGRAVKDGSALGIGAWCHEWIRRPLLMTLTRLTWS